MKCIVNLNILAFNTSCSHIQAPETRTSCNGRLPDPGKWVRGYFFVHGHGFTINEAEDSLLCAMPLSLKTVKRGNAMR